MKTITELHNKHKGEPIWVAGSDPTLADYPDNFLDNKISITLHLACLKFPNTTYRYFNESDRLVYVKGELKDAISDRNIYGYPFYNKSKKVCEEAVEDLNIGYYLNRKSYPPDGNHLSIFKPYGPKAMIDMVGEAINATSITFGGHGTCLHPCMYAAIMMGGNPINIIGCGFGAIAGKEHFGDMNAVDRKMRPTTPSFSGYRGDRMTRGLVAIMLGCKQHGIKVNWLKSYDKSLMYLDSQSKKS